MILRYQITNIASFRSTAISFNSRATNPRERAPIAGTASWLLENVLLLSAIPAVL